MDLPGSPTSDRMARRARHAKTFRQGPRTRSAVDGLTIKERKFLTAYIKNGGNATRAAIACGYSKKTAGTIGCELLRKPQIKAALEKHMEQSAASAAEVLATLTEVLHGGAAQAIKVDPTTGHPVYDFTGPEAQAKLGLIQELSYSDFGPRIKFYSRLEAAALLAKYHGLLRDRIEIESKPDVARLRSEILEKLGRGEN
jgi:phage terminase small subunit